MGRTIKVDWDRMNIRVQGAPRAAVYDSNPAEVVLSATEYGDQPVHVSFNMTGRQTDELLVELANARGVVAGREAEASAAAKAAMQRLEQAPAPEPLPAEAGE